MSPLVKVLMPAAAIVVVVTIFGRSPDSREAIGLKRPAAVSLLIWVAAAAVYMLATDYFMNWRGPWDWEPWRQASLARNSLRVAAVAILAPIAEELTMRGVLLRRLKKRMPSLGAVLLSAALWAALHYDYSLSIRSLFFGFGLLLAFARFHTGSLWVPIAMHVMWNFYAIW